MKDAPIIRSSLLRSVVLLSLLILPVRAWEESLPPDMLRDYVQADAVLDELPCAWRERVESIFRPAVQQCRSAREAVLLITSHMTELTGGIHYSPLRSKPNMNALESLAERRASCTGLSIMLVCALRSVGIPARAAFVITWGHIRGNHTWVEAWVDGRWEMIEFNQNDFNTPWVMESIGLLDTSRPEQRIYAVAPRSPYTLSFFDRPVHVEDVTARYLTLSRRWYAQQGIPPGHQLLMVDVQPRPANEGEHLLLEDDTGTVLAELPAPTQMDDIRHFATFHLPSKGSYYLRYRRIRTPIRATDRPAQIICLPAS